MPEISIIIPTLNEGGALQETIRHTRRAAGPDASFEMIMADCHSTDGTVTVAQEENVPVVFPPEDEPWRAHAVHAAALQAAGRVLLFLDADTLLPQNFAQLILQALQQQTYVGGAFTFAFREQHPGLRMVTAINRLRYRCLKNFYSDQAIFCRKKTYVQCGGIPLQPILADAGLCRRLKRYGKLTILPARAHTSGRRFLSDGILKTFMGDFRIWLKDLLRCSTLQEGLRYRAWNEKNGG